MQVIPTPLRGGGRKKQTRSPSASPSPGGRHYGGARSVAVPGGNVPAPLRGGGQRHNGHLSVSSKTSDFFNGGLRKSASHSPYSSYSFTPKTSGHRPSKSGHRSISDAAPPLSLGGMGSSSNVNGYTNVYSTGYNGSRQNRTRRQNSSARGLDRRQNSYW